MVSPPFMNHNKTKTEVCHNNGVAKSRKQRNISIEREKFTTPALPYYTLK
jgi:hypothetical protein